jgi:hypothetical protein
MYHDFPTKAPEETRTVTFDFSAYVGVGVLMSPVVTIVTKHGTDPTPSAMLRGAPVVSGQQVLQSVTGGVDKVDYIISCVVHSSPEIPESAGTLRVRKAT